MYLAISLENGQVMLHFLDDRLQLAPRVISYLL